MRARSALPDRRLDRRSLIQRPIAGRSKLRVVNRTTRWLLPVVLAILVVGAIVGAAVH